MKCPFCGSDESHVVDSRPADEQNAIRRRRECEACGKRFTTYERVEAVQLMVIKKDQTREQYSREKLERGIVLATYKRPVSAEQISALVDEIESEIFNSGEKEVETRKIGEMVMKRMKALDPVAYVRFASVYREFKDVDTFAQEITKLLKKKK